MIKKIGCFMHDMAKPFNQNIPEKYCNKNKCKMKTHFKILVKSCLLSKRKHFYFGDANELKL
jgi:hypothetical protein